MKKPNYIKQLIEKGEGQQLDFKFEISDAAKIARSLVAFANTDGGKLLIGVNDNGKIIGIKAQEEAYMIENAANNYCKPKVDFDSRRWKVEGKRVLEIIIPKSDNYPHMAPDTKGKFKAYIRIKDQNHLANSLMIKLWTKQKSLDNIVINYGETEQDLMKSLTSENEADINLLKNKTGLNKNQLENLLSDFILMDIVEMKLTEDKIVFSLKKS